MPLVQRIPIIENTSIANDSGVVRQKLPNRGLLYDLAIQMNWTNGATHAQDVSIFDAFDLIEIIGNGSEYLWSCTPAELYTLNAYLYKQLPNVYDTRGASGVQIAWLMIPFSYPMGNKNRYLDLSRYTDIEIRIHYSPTISATDGFATGGGSYAIYANIDYDGSGTAPEGFLQYKTVEQFTTAASGIKRIQVDGNNPLLALLVHNYHASNSLVGTFSKAEVLFNDGAKKYFSAVLGHYARELAIRMNIDLSFLTRTAVSNTDTTVILGDDLVSLSLEPLISAPTIGTTAIGHFRLTGVSGRTLTFGAFNDTPDGAATAQVAYTTDTNLLIVGRYMSVPMGFIIPFGLSGFMENAVIPDNVSRMHLDLTQNVASTVSRIGRLELAA